jgi:hypothetical protein
MSMMATREAPPARIAAAAIATLLNRQKPIARSGSAWWPGGLTSANAGSRVSQACRAASIVAPAARRATSCDSGLVNVSGSSIAAWPATSSSASRYAEVWTSASSARVASLGSRTTPPRVRNAPATASKTCARSGRSG